MGYEKAYKEALERARKLYKDAVTLQLEQDIKDYEYIFPELAESEDERIRKALLEYFGEECDTATINGIYCYKIYDWLEKQGEQKSTQGIEPFEAEHGKYYYCIKDYFCGGKKQASKGDVVQALRGLPIMGLNDASEYFLPINFIKCNSVCGEEDERIRKELIEHIKANCESDFILFQKFSPDDVIAWLEKQGKQKPTLSERYENIAQSEWFKRTHDGMSVSDEELKWTKEDEERLQSCISSLQGKGLMGGVDTINTKWLKSLKQRMEEQQ